MLVYDDTKKGKRKPIGVARPKPRKKPTQAPSRIPALPRDDSRPQPRSSQPVKQKKTKHKVQKSVVPPLPPLISQEQHMRQHLGHGVQVPLQIPFTQPGWSWPIPLRPAIPDDLDDRATVVSTKLDDVLTAIDQGAFSGREKDLAVNLSQFEDALEPQSRRSALAVPPVALRKVPPKHKVLNPFMKVDLYFNSRLPGDLPPLKLYLPAWPLVCLAAQYSERAYEKARGEERHTHIVPKQRGRDRALVIKSVPVDHMNVIVFAIRGTQSFRDWATNFHAQSASPANFLDDPGNFCHAGFLEVAKQIIAPVATRLRKLLEDNPARSSCSLVMTGHSAGGAVAALLFCHMLSAGITSDLVSLARCFKRIHCITFGAPPISMLPLQKPQSWQHRKSLFLSFVNEGDPVTRADPAYVRSLLDLYMSPAPSKASIPTGIQAEGKSGGPWKQFKLAMAKTPSQQTVLAPRNGPVWEVPQCSYSNAGRVVVLRQTNTKSRDYISAVTTTDQGLRGAVFGNPLMHMMKVYRERVEGLAAKAITGGAWNS